MKHCCICGQLFEGYGNNPADESLKIKTKRAERRRRVRGKTHYQKGGAEWERTARA